MSIHLICHMISSIDGRLLPSRWSTPAVPVDFSKAYEYAASQLNADGWMVGRTTMAEYGDCVTEEAPAAVRDAKAPRPVAFLGSRENRPLAIAWDPKGKLHFTDNGLPSGEHLVVVLGTQVAESHLAALRAVGVSYVFAGFTGDDLAGGLQQLENHFGVKKLLLEGGGIINGSFMKAGLINGWSILIYPGLDGLFGEPAIVGYQGKAGEKPADNVHLQLVKCQQLEGGVVWLRYLAQH